MHHFTAQLYTQFKKREWQTNQFMQKRAEKVLLVSESDIIVVGNFGGEQITIPFSNRDMI